MDVKDIGSIWFRAPPARRGPRPTLNRDEIVRIATEIADAEGLAAVSMRRIAAGLEAGTASLYWHVASKDDLHELMVDQAVGEIEVPDPSGDLERDLRGLAGAIHGMLRRHPWMVLLGIRPVLGPRTRRFGELAPRIFDALDVDEETRVQALAALNNYLYGFVHRELAWQQTRRRTGLSDAEWSEQLRAHVKRARDQDPDFAKPWEASVAVSDQAAFDFGLDCFVAGIIARIAREAGS